MSKPAEGSTSGAGAQGYRRPAHNMEDQVYDALRADGHVNASGIEVRMNDETGALTLSGEVATRDERRRAEECVGGIQGIGVVHNHLLVGDEGGDGARGADREFGRNTETADRPARTIGAEPESRKDH